MDDDALAAILIVPFGLVMIAIAGSMVVAGFVVWAVLSLLWWAIKGIGRFLIGRIAERQAYRHAVRDVDAMFNRFDRQVTAALRQRR